MKNIALALGLSIAVQPLLAATDGTWDSPPLDFSTVRIDHPSGFFYDRPFFQSIYDGVQIYGEVGESWNAIENIEIFVRSYSSSADALTRATVEYTTISELLVSFDWFAEVQSEALLTDEAYYEVGYYLGGEIHSLFSGSEYASGSGSIFPLLKSDGVPFGFYSSSTGGNIMLHISNISIQSASPVPEPSAFSVMIGLMVIFYAGSSRRLWSAKN